MNEQQLKNIEFCKYLQPIVSGCSGFIRTVGYMYHFPGCVILISFDECYLSIINLPVVYDIYMTANINTFLGLKEEYQMADFKNYIYFTGYNLKMDKMKNAYPFYSNIDNIVPLVYHEPDCYNITGFEEAVLSSEIKYVNVSDGNYSYRIYASKAITPLNKGDLASLDIFLSNELEKGRIVRYTVFKKKFKLNIQIFSKILLI